MPDEEHEPTYRERAATSIEKLPAGLRALAAIVLEVDDVVFGEEPFHDCGVLDRRLWLRTPGNTYRCHECDSVYRWDGSQYVLEAGSA